MQIETAEQVLLNALRTKINTIAEEARAKDIAKFSADVKSVKASMKALMTQILALKKKVEKNPKLHVALDSYSCVYQRLESEIQEHNTLIQTRNCASYSPEFKKEKEQISKYILELKLGTALMSDLQVLLDMIAKL